MKEEPETSVDRQIQLDQLKALQLIGQLLANTGKPTLYSLGYIDDDDFIRIFHISRNTAANLRRHGKVRYTTCGKRIIYKISDVIAMLNEGFNRA